VCESQSALRDQCVAKKKYEMIVDRVEVEPGMARSGLSEQFLTAPAFCYCSTYSSEFVMFAFKGKQIK